MASKERILHVLSLLCEAFGRKPTEAMFAVYKLSLSDVSDEMLDVAAVRVARECKFMPTPAELREMAGCVQEADRGLLAWAAAVRAVRYGPYRHMDFDDRAINATIRNLGGWVGFVSRFGGADEEKWIRQEFIKCYASLSKGEVGDEAGAVLPGLSECEIRHGKMCQPTPVLIVCGTGRVDPPRIWSTAKTPRIASRGGEPKRIGEVSR